MASGSSTGLALPLKARRKGASRKLIASGCRNGAGGDVASTPYAVSPPILPVLYIPVSSLAHAYPYHLSHPGVSCLSLLLRDCVMLIEIVRVIAENSVYRHAQQ